MSIHAELSPEAKARLDATRRNSTISSFASGILGVTLIGLIAALIAIKPLILVNAPIVVHRPERPIGDPPPRPTIPRLPAKPSQSSHAAPRVFVANLSSPTAIPIPPLDTPAPSPDFGQGEDFDDGWNPGGSPGGPSWIIVPPVMQKRCSPEDRLQRLRENGGTERCELAVVKGLDWLQSTQNPDGSWSNRNKSAMTGLALLAYLGHCETPLSQRYGDSVFRGLTWLVDTGLRNHGRLVPKGAEIDKHWPYEHAIACYALAEAATFCREFGVQVPELREITRQAGQYIIDNQHQSGGWEYSYAEDGSRGGDLSITAWQVQALKACHHTGLDFRNLRKCSSRALDYVAARQDTDGGYGYSNQQAAGGLGYKTLTGAGMLCMQMWHKDSHSDVRSAARYVLGHSKFDYNSEFCDLYGHYYESQAMMRRGGEQWKSYNSIFRDQVLNNQASDGSWKTPGGGAKPRAAGATFMTDRHYRTCLNILMLEVYYRFLPGTGSAVSR